MTAHAGGVPLVIGVAWAALVVATAARRRPPPSRVLALARRASSVTAPGAADATARRPVSPLEVVGRAVCGLVRRSPPEPGQARALGATLVVTAVALALAPALAPAAVAAGWALPRLVSRRDEGRRLAALEAGLPEAVDLLALAVGAGGNVILAVAAAGRRGSGPLAEELRRVADEVARGRRLADALDELPALAGEATRPLATALAGAERYGVPLGPALERIGDDVRRQRQRRAEEAARKVPVRLLFPLVVCILPAFALLTVAPLVAGALQELRL